MTKIKTLLLLIVCTNIFVNIPIRAQEQVIIDQPLHELIIDSNITDIEWHINGRTLGVATSDGFRIYSGDMQLITDISTGHSVQAFSWNPDGNLFATTQEDFIEIWAWGENTELASKSVTLESDGLQMALDWNTDGSILASIALNFPQSVFMSQTSSIGNIQFWNTTTWTLQSQSTDYYLIDLHYSTTHLIDWHPTDSKSLVAIGNSVELEDNQFKFTSNLIAYVLNADTGDQIQAVTLKSPLAYSVSWHPDNDMIAVGSEPGTILYDMVNREEISALGSYSFDIEALSWHPDGNYLLSESDMIDIRSSSVIGAFQTVGKISDVQWNPDGVRIAIGYQNGTIRIEDATLLPDFHILTALPTD